MCFYDLESFTDYFDNQLQDLLKAKSVAQITLLLRSTAYVKSSDSWARLMGLSPGLTIH